MVKVLIAVRRGVGAFRGEYFTEKVLTVRSKIRKVQSTDVSLVREYFFWSEKGVFRFSKDGLYEI